jgi:hypothetical protein
MPYHTPPVPNARSRTSPAALRPYGPAAQGAPRRVEVDPVDSDRLGDVLDPVLAHRLEGEVELRLDLVPDVAGDADAARLGQPLQAGRDIDTIAQDVAVLDDDVADVDADPERDAPILGHRGLALDNAVLNRDRAFDRIHRARELDQGTIAHQLDDSAVVLGDQRLDELLAQRPQPRDRAGLVVADQPAVADHVRGQNRRELAIRARSHDGTLRRCRRN